MKLLVKNSMCSNLITFFSRNVGEQLREDISHANGFSLSTGIGKYLGSIPMYGYIKRDGYKTVIEKMQSKLLGWNSLCLSMAGRITLAQSVLGNMATH